MLHHSSICFVMSVSPFSSDCLRLISPAQFSWPASVVNVCVWFLLTDALTTSSTQKKTVVINKMQITTNADEHYNTKKLTPIGQAAHEETYSPWDDYETKRPWKWMLVPPISCYVYTNISKIGCKNAVLSQIVEKFTITYDKMNYKQILYILLHIHAVQIGLKSASKILCSTEQWMNSDLFIKRVAGQKCWSCHCTKKYIHLRNL